MPMIEHIAIIMDGNGRWAKERRRPRVWGHVRGSQKVSEIVEAAADHPQIKSLTLYAFSTENWSRPKEEVTSLFFLLQKYISKERERIIRNRISFNVLGRISGVSPKTQDLIEDLVMKTCDFVDPKLVLNFAFDYGGREEIVMAANRWISSNPGKKISEAELARLLYTKEEGQNIDLLIRTGGDLRVSNFLLWQIAYAELYFCKTYWPDFTVKEFLEIYSEVSLRERRFGAVVSAVKGSNSNMADAGVVADVSVAMQRAKELRQHYSKSDERDDLNEENFQ
ncbi:MAG: di-trans,poly-cis-decaprenylcistransferase [Oligoflexia bacterium]|nr:di-trans,poly-cis-decaprenylcistransferase [Oligoflexia bacterium]